MDSRERVLTAIAHREPDRVPIDIGGSIVAGIMAGALARLMHHLGIEDGPVKVHDQLQMLGEVTLEIANELRVDVMPVEPEVVSFNLQNRNFKPVLAENPVRDYRADFRLTDHTGSRGAIH